MKTYLINYEAHFIDGGKECHIMRVRNCHSDMHAKVKLDEYLKRKLPGYKQMFVSSCVEDRPSFGFFDDIFSKV
jgi:hypothetical protein